MGKQKTFLNTAELKRRGWRDAMIRDLLGEADAARRRRRRTTPPQKLYLRARVHEVEAQAGFKAALAQAEAGLGVRRQAALSAADIKRQALLRQVSGINVSVPLYALDHIRQAAVGHWQGRNPGCDAAGANEATVQRWMVNYIRHRCTCYDGQLRELRGRIGVDIAAGLIKKATLRAIGGKYPALEAACDKQAQGGYRGRSRAVVNLLDRAGETMNTPRP